MSLNFKSLRTFFFINVLVFNFSNASAQFEDSIKDALKHQPKVLLKFDTRNSIIGNRRAEFFGVKVALSFNKIFDIGAGYHFLNNSNFSLISVVNQAGLPELVPKLPKLNYVSVYVEYTFYRSKRWEFTIPVQIGFGNSRYQYVINHQKYTESKRFVVLYEPSVSGTYYIFNWLAVGADYGYRLVLPRNKGLSERFTSPIYVGNVSIYYDRLFKALFPKAAEKIEQRF